MWYNIDVRINIIGGSEMKLQILVSQYKENEDVISPLLTSISIQQGIDLGEIGVVIVNDGSDVKLSDEFIGKFPYHIDYILAPHGGVSKTRNTALDFATADYVMFCDADDMFLNNAGLYLIFNEIEKGEFNALISRFSEEVGNKETSKRSYINHGYEDATFIHGKVYRRQFLIDKKIRWCDELTIHEDSYFSYLCRVCAEDKNIRFCNDVFYLWKYRPDSVCRTDSKWIMKSLPHMVKSSAKLTDELIKRGKLVHARTTAANLLIRCYFRMNMDEWNDTKLLEYRLKNEKAIKEFYEKYWPLVEGMDKTQYNDIWKRLVNDALNKGVYQVKITFAEWQNMMGKK